MCLISGFLGDVISTMIRKRVWISKNRKCIYWYLLNFLLYISLFTGQCFTQKTISLIGTFVYYLPNEACCLCALFQVFLEMLSQLWQEKEFGFQKTESVPTGTCWIYLYISWFTGQFSTQKTISLIGTFGKRLSEAFTHFSHSVASLEKWWTLTVSYSVSWLLLQSPTHHFRDILSVTIQKKLQRYISEHANIPWVNIIREINNLNSNFLRNSWLSYLNVSKINSSFHRNLQQVLQKTCF